MTSVACLSKLSVGALRIKMNCIRSIICLRWSTNRFMSYSFLCGWYQLLLSFVFFSFLNLWTVCNSMIVLNIPRSFTKRLHPVFPNRLYPVVFFSWRWINSTSYRLIMTPPQVFHYIYKSFDRCGPLTFCNAMWLVTRPMFLPAFFVTIRSFLANKL